MSEEIIQNESLEKVKNALRIDGNEHDEELTDLISAAKAEMIESGAHESKVIESNSLIFRAITLYCKANFGYDDENGKFAQAFERMLIKISLLHSLKE